MYTSSDIKVVMIVGCLTILLGIMVYLTNIQSLRHPNQTMKSLRNILISSTLEANPSLTASLAL